MFHLVRVHATILRLSVSSVNGRFGQIRAVGRWWTNGALPENVNCAVKSSSLLGFLESVPEVSAELKEPETKERKFEEVVKSTEQGAVLVLVY